MGTVSETFSGMANVKIICKMIRMHWRLKGEKSLLSYAPQEEILVLPPKLAERDQYCSRFDVQLADPALRQPHHHLVAPPQHCISSTIQSLNVLQQ